MLNLYRFSCRSITYLMILISGVLTLFSLVSTTFVDPSDRVYYVGDTPLVHALLILILIWLMLLLKDKLRVRVTDRVIIAALIFITVAMAVYIGVSFLPPRFDQRAVRSVAADLAVGIKDDFKPGGYAEIYPYNHGIILFYRFIMIFTGYEDHIVLQYINLLFMILTVTAFYFILKRMTPLYREIVPGIILFMPYWGYATFLYGNIPGFCFGMWALYFCLLFLFDQRLYEAAAAGILMAAAFRFKENFAILMIAVAITTLCEAIKTRRVKVLILIPSMVIFMALSGVMINGLLASMADYTPSKGIPGLPYIAMGLHEHSERGAGWHDNYPENIYEATGHDGNMTEELAKQDIKASVENFAAHPKYSAGFFIRKTASMWNDPAYYSWTLQQGRDEMLDERIFHPGTAWVYPVMNVLQTYLYFFTLLYFIFKRDDTDFRRLFFALFFIGGFLCHLFWEAASQYALFYAMGLTIYATLGAIETCRRVQLWSTKKRIQTAVIVLAAGLILSLPAIPTLLTLNRDNARLAGYLSEISASGLSGK